MGLCQQFKAIVHWGLIEARIDTPLLPTNDTVNASPFCISSYEFNSISILSL